MSWLKRVLGQTESIPADKSSNTALPEADARAVRLPFSLGYNGHSHLYRNGTVALGINFNAATPASIDGLAILAGGKRFPALEWEPFNLNGSLGQSFKFNLTEIVNSAGEQSLKELVLDTLVKNREYRSSPFDISSLIL